MKSITTKKVLWYELTYFATVLGITYTLLPAFRAYMPSIVGKFVILLIWVCSFLGAIMQKHWYKIKNFTALVSAVFLIAIVYFGRWKPYFVSLGRTDSNTNLLLLLNFWLFFILSAGVVKFTDSDKKRILKYYLFLTLVTSFTTIIGCITYPMAPRLLAGYATETERLFFNRLNIGGYEFNYGIMLSVPLLIYIIYKSNNNKFFYLTVLIIELVVIIISQYTIAIVLVVGIIIILYVLKNKKNVFIIPAAIFLMLFFISGMFEQLLYLIRSFLYNQNLNEITIRIDEIIVFLNNNRSSGDLGARLGLYEKSLNIFLNNPVFGCLFNYTQVGGHSEILDLMGTGGIIGLIFFAIPIFNYYKLIKSLNKDNFFKTFFLAEFILFITLAIVNTLFTSSDIALTFFILPALLVRENNNEKII